MTKEAFLFTGEDALNYEQYLGPILFEPASQEFIKYLGNPNTHSVLEISAGSGRLTRHLRKYFPSATDLVASDISVDMLSVAEKQLAGESIEFRVADAQALPFDNASFDLAICQYGLMFLGDKQKGFNEAYRILKPGGRYIFSTWDSTESMPLLHIVFNETIIPFFREEDPARFITPFSLYKSSQLVDFLTAAGFRNSRVVPVHFTSRSTVDNIVNGFLLKHPISRQVVSQDPAALPILAENMKNRITKEFGDGEISFELKSLIGIGEV